MTSQKRGRRLIRSLLLSLQITEVHSAALQRGLPVTVLNVPSLTDLLIKQSQVPFIISHKSFSYFSLLLHSR